MEHSPQKVQIVLFSILAAWFSAFAAPAEAAEGVKISLNPTRFEFRTYAGQKVTGTLKFWNGTDDYMDVTLQAEDFAPEGESGHIKVGAAADPARSLKTWITPKLPSLIVFPKQNIQLDFTVNVPENAPPGSYWGAISVRALPPKTGEGSAIMPEVASIVLLQVNGDADERLSLESFSSPKLVDSPPVALASRFRNEGNTYLKPEGKVEIKNLFGKVVATAPLEGENVLPGAIRRIDTSLGQGFWLGRYTASLEAEYGNAPTPSSPPPRAGGGITPMLTAKTTFWAVPWRSAGPTALVWLGLVALIVWKRKNIKAAMCGFREAE